MKRDKMIEMQIKIIKFSHIYIYIYIYELKILHLKLDIIKINFRQCCKSKHKKLMRSNLAITHIENNFIYLPREERIRTTREWTY